MQALRYHYGYSKMSTTTLTPNMNLIVPTVGVNGDPGPDYGNNQNQDLFILDSHNHGPGSGVPISPSGMNISTNLNFQNNSPYNVYSVIFSVPASNSALTNLYTNTQNGGGIIDLFFNDGAGNVIAITKAGEVNATIASIPGESYSGGTFTWVQGNGSTTPANFDIGSITIRPNTAGTTNGVIVGPPSSISSQYNVQLPIVPGATSIMQLDSSGNMIATLVPDNATIIISSQVLQIGTVQTANIANLSITDAKIADSTLTKDKNAPYTPQVSASSGSFTTSSTSLVDITNQLITITTFGNSVEIVVAAQRMFFGGSGANTFALLRLFRDGTIIYTVQLDNSVSGDTTFYTPNFTYPDASIVSAPGTYVYQLQVSNGQGGTTFGMTNSILTAYEL